MKTRTIVSIPLTLAVLACISIHARGETNPVVHGTDGISRQSASVPFSLLERPAEALPQNIYEEREALWGIGLNAGLLSGMGVGIRFHPKGRFAAQIVGGGIKLSTVLYSFGAEGQFDFDFLEKSRLYGYAGLGYYSNGKSGDDKLKGPFRAGLGVAYEWIIARSMVFNVNLGFTYFSNGGFLPLPQVGLFYYFK